MEGPLFFPFFAFFPLFYDPFRPGEGCHFISFLSFTLGPAFLL